MSTATTCFLEPCLLCSSNDGRSKKEEGTKEEPENQFISSQECPETPIIRLTRDYNLVVRYQEKYYGVSRIVLMEISPYFQKRLANPHIIASLPTVSTGAASCSFPCIILPDQEHVSNRALERLLWKYHDIAFENAIEATDIEIVGMYLLSSFLEHPIRLAGVRVLSTSVHDRKHLDTKDDFGDINPTSVFSQDLKFPWALWPMLWGSLLYHADKKRDTPLLEDLLYGVTSCLVLNHVFSHLVLLGAPLHTSLSVLSSETLARFIQLAIGGQAPL